MTAQLLPNVVQQFRDSNGNVLAGGKLYSYQAGTTTPLSTYTDETALTPNTNPVVLDSTGSASIWLSSSAYKLKLTDSLGNVLWTVDNVSIINPGSVDNTKIASNLAGSGISQNLSTLALDVQVDSSTIEINANTLRVKDLGITNAKLAPTAVDTTKVSALVEVVIRNSRDNSCPGVYQTIPQYEWSSPTLISTPGTVPPGAATCAKWSPNGEFLAVGSGATPFIDIYQRSQGTTLTKLANPGTLPAGAVTDLSWSPLGDFLAVSHSTTPFITIYQRSGNTFTKLSNPSSIPTTAGAFVAFSPDSDFLCVSQSSPNGSIMYERSGTTFTDITFAGGLTSPNITGNMFWSPDSSLFGTRTVISFALRMFQRTDATFTLITNPDITSLTDVVRGAFSPSGQFLCLLSSATPYMALYTVSGTTFTKISNPVALPAGAPNCVAWSLNSEYLFIGHATSPFLTIYSVSGTTFTKVSDPGVLPAAAVTGGGFSHTKQFLAVASGTTPFIQVYQTASTIPSNGIFWTKGVTNV